MISPMYLFSETEKGINMSHGFPDGWEHQKPAPRSSVVIARLLASQGYDSYVAEQIERYNRKTSGLSNRQKQALDETAKELSEMCKKLTKAERLLLGRFIGYQCRINFDTGLKIGLACFAIKHDNIEV